MAELAESAIAVTFVGVGCIAVSVILITPPIEL